MNNIISKKRSGTGNIVSAALVCVISFLGLYIMAMLIIYTYRALDAMSQVTNCMRSYLTKMEIQGCLTDMDAEALVGDLQILGLTEIRLSGNFSEGICQEAVAESLGTAYYGEQVQLQITGKMRIKRVTQASIGLLEFTFAGVLLPVSLSQKGISIR